MVKVIGYEFSNGDFTNDNGDVISYDNIKIHTVTDAFENIVGLGSSTLKIKRSDFKKLTGCEKPDEILDKEIVPVYTPVGNSVRLTAIQIVKQ